MDENALDRNIISYEELQEEYVDLLEQDRHARLTFLQQERRIAELEAELAQLREEDTVVKFEQYTKGGG